MRTVREIVVSDRLWSALERLAGELGTERDSLVEQALHAFLRFHGLAGDPPTVAPAPPAPRQVVVRRVLDTARDLERAIGTPVDGAPVLWLHGEQGPIGRVERDRYVIGRGKHCDLVIDSAKVSREHAVIRREVDGWWIEDLGSSNGTWFQKARVDRRRIEDGDEYFVCAEKIRCALS